MVPPRNSDCDSKRDPNHYSVRLAPVRVARGWQRCLVQQSGDGQRIPPHVIQQVFARATIYFDGHPHYVEMAERESMMRMIEVLPRNRRSGTEGIARKPIYAAHRQPWLRNADERFADVKGFVSRADASNGIHVVSVPNGARVEVVHSEGMDDESYALLRILDSVFLQWEGHGAGRYLAEQRVEQAGGCVWASCKHVQGIESGRAHRRGVAERPLGELAGQARLHVFRNRLWHCLFQRPS